MFAHRLIPFCLLLFIVALSGCNTSTAQESGDIPDVTTKRATELDRVIPEIMNTHGVNTTGVGVIKNGVLVWTGYYGEQSAGVPASKETLFNVASITKTITAEAILHMVEDGQLDLDESMAPYWVDPDLEQDPRHTTLTPRMTLNHSTGFLNWRNMHDDRKLQFVNDPGTTFGYSGEGIEYLMRYAQRKSGAHPEELVKKYVFDPMGMTGVSYSVRNANFERIAKPKDENGREYDPYCRPGGFCGQEGRYFASDDMVITVESYAKFLISVMNEEGLSKEIIADRNRVQVTKPADQRVVDCTMDVDQTCPDAQGYGLGWEVLDYGDTKVLSHSGSDWAELTLGYVYTNSKDGLIIFFNAPNELAVRAMLDTLLLMDSDSPMIGGYRRWITWLESQGK
ncbi:MAG: beta-lactamase family protein [Rhodothermaceae bacterium]|nr:beta-lactamase family protein [Rhodothermaceae bacterium]